MCVLSFDLCFYFYKHNFWKFCFFFLFSMDILRVLSSKHTERLDYAGQLDMETIMHNMTKVSAKGIVQVADRAEDLPHWVLSAMKCLANWPKQLKTVNGKESCLPNYEGFEHDVFNVVKDYFLTLPGPLTTCPLYEFILEAYAKAEGTNEAQRSQQDTYSHPDINCGVHPGSINHPCSRPYTETNLDPPQGNQFYTMITNNEDLSVLSNQERVARIKQTFQILPPLATSSLQNSNTSNTTLLSSGHSTFDTISYSLSPDMTTTAIMKQFLPPNTCFETAFVEESPVTRIVPQKEHETLHIKRSWSGRSLSHIPTDWATKTTATQTDTQEQNSSSLKRIPKWKRAGRFRKSIAVMETQDRRRSSSTSTSGSESGGIINGAFRDTPVSNNPGGGHPRVQARTRQLYSSSDLPNPAASVPIRGYSSVDNLLDRENQFEEQFMMKYKQVSGDLRSSCDLVDLSRRNETKDRSFIESKAVRKEKKKKRFRNSSTDRLGYDTDNDVKYSDHFMLEESLQHCYINRGMEGSPGHGTNPAPLASHDISELSPVPFSRHTKYNASYRLATNQPATPAQRFSIPRTSTQIDLQHKNNNNNEVPKSNHLTPGDCLYVRAEPYNCLNSDVSNSLASERLGRENIYTRSGAGPIQRYSAQTTQKPRTNLAINPRKPLDNLRPDTFNRNTAHRASRVSQATVDSGRYSDFSRGSVRTVVAPPVPSSLSDCGNYARYSHSLPHSVLVEKLKSVAKSNPARTEESAVEIFKLLCLLVPPSNRRKLQLLLKFIKKV